MAQQTSQSCHRMGDAIGSRPMARWTPLESWMGIPASAHTGKKSLPGWRMEHSKFQSRVSLAIRRIQEFTMPQTQLFFPAQTPAPSSTPRLDCSNPIVCGRATGCDLASTLALNLKTKHQMIPKCESMPRKRHTSRGPAVGSGSSRRVSMPAFHHSYYMIGAPTPDLTVALQRI